MVITVNGEIRRDRNGNRYELLPPEGGWGYMVTLSITIFSSVTLVPVVVFGMIFGSFLESIGDETFGTTMTNAIFSVVFSGTGIVSNHLLQHYSCRKVGLIGAVIFFTGALSTVFVNNLYQLILTWGVVQGFGVGLMMPACYTSFNGYFNKKQTLMMSIAQTLIGIITMGWPSMIAKFLEIYGWRQTQLLVAALSLHCFIAMISLQPAKWHMKKRYLEDVPLTHLENTLLENEQPLLARKSPSTIGIGSFAASVTSINNVQLEHDDNTNKSVWMKIYDGLDLDLFKEPKFINISFGLALSITAELAFLSLLPMILKNADFSDERITWIMTVYFASDLVGNIALSLASALIYIRNRYLSLGGALFSAIFRIAFVSHDSYMWILTVSAILGFLRTFIHIPLPLVIAEVYKDRFSSAFTLFMVVCGSVALFFRPLLSYVKFITQSDTMVVNLLTFAFLLCAIPWIIELLFEKLKNKDLRK